MHTVHNPMRAQSIASSMHKVHSPMRAQSTAPVMHSVSQGRQGILDRDVSEIQRFLLYIQSRIKIFFFK